MPGTEGFRDLYDEVTKALRARADEIGALGVGDKHFVNFLIFGFWREYEAWKIDPALHPYLEKFRRRSAFKAFSVIGHAFLHMAYDLPRTCADSRVAQPPLSIDDARKSWVFLQLRPAFDTNFAEVSRRPGVFGVLAYLGKLFSKKAPVLRIAARWIHDLRLTAWVLGEILAHHPERPRLEQQLLDDINAAAEEVIQHRRNPVYWTAILTPATVMAAMPLWVPAEAIRAYGAPALTGLVAAALLYLVVAYWGLARVTDRLGYALYRAMLQSVRRHEDGAARLAAFLRTVRRADDERGDSLLLS